MSEAEKIRRLNYKKNRKKWIFIQIVAIVLVAIIAISCFAIYSKLNETYYIEYTEKGEIDYKVLLKENSFYEEEWLGEGQAYVATLIDRISTDLAYDLRMDASNVAYEYSYSVFAQLLVKDKKSGVSLYDPIFNLVPEKTLQATGSTLGIRENVAIDYGYYDNIAANFKNSYGLTNSDSSLVVTMKVAIISRSDSFESSNNNTYSVSMVVPLLAEANTVNISETVSVPTSESKVLACKSAISEDIFKNIAIIAACLDAFLILLILAFAYLTRNEDINYTIKVNRLVNAYKAFIQKVVGGFTTKGYQLVKIATFDEMLAIRDTIQSPILMSENDDQTRTCFFIPTNTHLLYMFDIKVDNYDEIYGTDDAETETEDTPEEVIPEAPAEAPVEAVVTEAPVDETVPEVVEEVSPEETAPEVVEEAPVDETAPEVVEEAPVDETAPEVVEEAPVDETVPEVVEEAPVDETVPEVVAEALQEKTAPEVVEETPVDETVPEVVLDTVNEDTYERINPEYLPVNVDLPPVIIIDNNSDEEEEEEAPLEDEDAFDAPIEDEEDKDLPAYGARYDYSFEAKLALATEETKTFYRQIVSFAKSYGAVKVARSWKRERIYKGRNLFALLVFRGTKLAVTLAYNHADLDAKYHAQDVSMYKKYERTPSLMRITSPRKVAQAIELLTALFEGAGLKNKSLGVVVPPIEHKSRKRLILENLIKTEVDPHSLEDIAPNAPVVEETAPEVVEETPKEETAPEVVEETPKDETAPEVVEETPKEETAPEVVEEAPKEETATLDTIIIPTDSSEDEEEETAPVEDEDAFDAPIEDEEDKDLPTYGAKYDYSFEAKLALATDETKMFYRQIASFAKSYGAVKVARSWKRERIYKGRKLFALLVFRGTKLAVTLAYNHADLDAKYHAQDVSMYKKYERTPSLMRITSPRKVAQAIELLTALFEGAGLKNKSLGVVVPPIEHKSRKRLILENLIKTEVDPETLIDVHTHLTLLVQPDENMTASDIERALTAPTVELSDIDFVDEVDEVYEEDEEHPGVDVIGVVWPERAKKNKVYRYDPNGEVLEDGDIVLVPTSDRHRGREVVRKAAVAHGNHKIDPDSLKHPLKKVIAVVKRKLEDILSGN